MSFLPQLLLWALAALWAAFSLLFLVARRLRNFGVVDVAWSAAFAPLSLAYALCLDGAPWRRALVGGLACLWSLRLAVHLGRRVAALHPEEDGRYRALRRAWAGRLDRTMYLFFVAQAVSVLLLSAPFALAAGNPAQAFSFVELAGVALVLTAVAGEALADAQLAAFKRAPANRGRVCERGLWRYSRHPNYFFEWLAWLGLALVALPAPWGGLALACPAGMYLLLTRVTGVPYTEQQLLRSKGEAYRDYQRRTPAFFPGPPKLRPLQP